MEPTNEAITKQLRTVIDPEVNLNIVDMGLVYGVTVSGPTITVDMTLTTPGCPMRSYMENSVVEALSDFDGIEIVDVNIVWDPVWTPDKIDKDALDRLNRGEY